MLELISQKIGEGINVLFGIITMIGGAWAAHFFVRKKVRAETTAKELVNFEEARKFNERQLASVKEALDNALADMSKSYVREIEYVQQIRDATIRISKLESVLESKVCESCKKNLQNDKIN